MSASNKSKNTRKKKNNTIASRVITLEDLYDKLSDLTDDVKKIREYMKIESDIQEMSNREYIIKLYSYNAPTSRAIPININNFYASNNQPITDVDGLIMLEHKITYQPKCSQEIINRIQLDSKERGNFCPNIATCVNTDDIEYILIESKHSLSKQKIDKKLEQLSMIRDIFTDISKLPSITTNDKYMNMIKQLQFETGLSLSNMSHQIYLIFASDAVTAALVQYIYAINQGIIDEKQYNQLTTSMFYSDNCVKDYIKRIINDKLTSQTLINRLSERASLSEIKAEIMLRSDYTPMEHCLTAFFQPYSDIQPILSASKDIVGLLQFNRVFLPKLFHITSLNSNATSVL